MSSIIGKQIGKGPKTDTETLTKLLSEALRNQDTKAIYKILDSPETTEKSVKEAFAEVFGSRYRDQMHATSLAMNLDLESKIREKLKKIETDAYAKIIRISRLLSGTG